MGEKINSYKELRVLEDTICDKMDEDYDQIIGQVVSMINQADKWLIR